MHAHGNQIEMQQTAEDYNLGLPAMHAQEAARRMCVDLAELSRCKSCSYINSNMKHEWFLQKLHEQSIAEPA
jgi:hypothetical protein